MSRKLISTITIILGVIVAVTGAVALPLAQVNPTISFYMTIAGLGAAAAAGALRHPAAVRQAKRAAKKSKNALLVIGLSVTILSQTACPGPKPPSRATLENIQRGGQTVAQVIEVNRSLPDQLFKEGLIPAEVRDSLNTAIAEALPEVISFNTAMAAVLTEEKPNLKPLLPVALRMLQRVDKLNLDIPGWKEIFTGIQIGARVIATYFAITISELRTLGLSDKQIYSLAKVPASSHALELIGKYAKEPVTAHTGGSQVASE